MASTLRMRTAISPGQRQGFPVWQNKACRGGLGTRQGYIKIAKDETARPKTRREGYTKHLYLVTLNHRTGTFVGKDFETSPR